MCWFLTIHFKPFSTPHRFLYCSNSNRVQIDFIVAIQQDAVFPNQELKNFYFEFLEKCNEDFLI